MMSESRQVLAVDEQRTTLEFLHSVLPLVGGEHFEILRVLSAEEALLELRHKPYDLLVAGLRLPGMDGLELSRRAKRLRPQMGVILATGRPLDEIDERAEAAGVDHLLHKPLDAEAFLAAVRAALPAAPPPVARGARAYASEEAVALPSAVIRRLETLGGETGAGQVVLATVDGEILHVTGGQLHRDIARLVAAASTGVSRALDLSGHLSEAEPKAVQFVEGKTTDLYWANVGRDYFVAILFDAQLRRGRIGTVWVFTQRAVSDLKRLLARRDPGPPASSPAPERRPAPKATPAQVAKEADAPEPAADDQEPVGKARAGSGKAGGEAAADLPQAGGQQVNGAEQNRSAEDQALDTFWEEALAADSGDDAFSAGISLAEAKAKGLVAEDFNPAGWEEGAGN